MSNQSLWYYKYKPNTVEDYIWKDQDLKDKVIKWIENPSSLPHLILHGPPGTGKSSLGNIIINELNIEIGDFFKRNGSIHNGINTIRDIDEFCQMGGWSTLKIVMFDEAERLTIDAQEGLRSLMDQYDGYVRFIFTCNDIGKIHNALKSRCQIKTIDKLDQDTFAEKLGIIANTEIGNLDDNDISVIMKIFEMKYPDMRAAINLMEDCYVNGKLTMPSKDNTSVKNSSYNVIPDILIGGKKDFSIVREFINGLMNDEIEGVYKYLWQNSFELFNKKEGDAVIIISKHLVDHQQVTYPEINLASCFAYLILME